MARERRMPPRRAKPPAPRRARSARSRTSPGSRDPRQNVDRLSARTAVRAASRPHRDAVRHGQRYGATSCGCVFIPTTARSTHSRRRSRRPSWPTPSCTGQGIWARADVEADERAAWRGLVAAHGTGRASWIVDTYQPTNLRGDQRRRRQSDEILVIPTQTPLARGGGGGHRRLLAGGVAGGRRRRSRPRRRSPRSMPRSAPPAPPSSSPTMQPFNLSDRPAAPLQEGRRRVDGVRRFPGRSGD